MPGITFSSDIIVGFPGETEEDFVKTLELVQKVGYMQLFTVIYSKRTGTKAAELPDPTPRKMCIRDRVRLVLVTTPAHRARRPCRVPAAMAGLGTAAAEMCIRDRDQCGRRDPAH